MKIPLTVNGVHHQLDLEPDMPLLLVLRNDLGLHSPRFGCGKEQCGACRVLVDDKLRYSCTLQAQEASGCAVKTLEGFSTDETLHPLQEAFLELNAGQCGYCLSGILVTACHLLVSNPNPDRRQIQEALADHLCRCGAHNRIINAVLRGAQLVNESF